MYKVPDAGKSARVEDQPTTATEAKLIMNMSETSTKSKWYQLVSLGLNQTIEGTLGAFRTFANIPGAGTRTAYFAAFVSWPGVLSKNTESLRNSDALMCVAVLKGSPQAVAETAEKTYPPRTVRI